MRDVLEQLQSFGLVIVVGVALASVILAALGFLLLLLISLGVSANNSESSFGPIGLIILLVALGVLFLARAATALATSPELTQTGLMRWTVVLLALLGVACSGSASPENAIAAACEPSLAVADPLIGVEVQADGSNDLQGWVRSSS